MLENHQRVRKKKKIQMRNAKLRTQEHSIKKKKKSVRGQVPTTTPHALQKQDCSHCS